MSRRYTKDHEWVEFDGTVAIVGISDHAQEQLGDVVFVDLPEIGREVVAEEPMAVVESVKAASDVYAPIGGKVVEVNEALSDNPGLVNEAPEGDGWFVKLEPEDAAALDALMDEAAYAAFVETLS
ncbi:MAG: glycine cleavage system protein GcvH [Pseudomonadota bacterium]